MVVVVVVVVLLLLLLAVTSSRRRSSTSSSRSSSRFKRAARLVGLESGVQRELLRSTTELFGDFGISLVVTLCTDFRLNASRLEAVHLQRVQAVCE